MNPHDFDRRPTKAARISVGIISAIFALIFSVIVFFEVAGLTLKPSNTGLYIALIISLLLLAMFSVTTHRLLIDPKSNKRIFNPYVLLAICAILFMLSLLVIAAIAQDAYVNGLASLDKGNSRSLIGIIFCPIFAGWATLYSFNKIKRKR